MMKVVLYSRNAKLRLSADLRFRDNYLVVTSESDIRFVAEHEAKGRRFKVVEVGPEVPEELVKALKKPAGFSRGVPYGIRLRRAEDEPKAKMIDSVRGTEEEENPPTPDLNPVKMPVDTEPDDGEDTGIDLDDLTRDDLDEVAAKVGIENAESLPNKGAVKAAIQEVSGGE